MARNFNINIDLKDFNGKMGRLLANLKDYQPVWRKYIRYHQKVIVPAIFNTKGTLGGLKWENYSEKYSKKVGRKTATMRRSNKLYKAVTGGDGWIQTLDKQSFNFGIDGNVVPYANRHQSGGDEKYPMPQRVIIATKGNNLPRRGMAMLLQMMDDHIRKGT